MTPKDTPKSSHSGFLCNGQLRGSFGRRWKQVQRHKISHEESLNQRGLHWDSPFRDQEISLKGRRKDCRNQRSCRTSAKHDLHKSCKHAHRSSQKLKWQTQSLCGSAPRPWRWHFCGSPNSRMGVSLIVLLAFESLSTHWIALSNLDAVAFTLSYCVLFHSFWLSSLGVLLLAQRSGEYSLNNKVK